MTYVLADIHGDNAAFDDILWQIGFSDDDRLFIIGNVIDREGDGDRAASAHYENAERHAGVGFSYGGIIPRKPKRPSAYPGCPNLTDGTYCAEHKKYTQLQYSKYERSPQQQSDDASFNAPPLCCRTSDAKSPETANAAPGFLSN